MKRGCGLRCAGVKQYNSVGGMRVTKELITVKEAAKRLGVHPNTVYKPARAGRYEQETINRRAYLVWENGGLVAVAKSQEPNA